MIIQYVSISLIATSQGIPTSPSLMYLDDKVEIEGLLEVGYTLTVWNVYINQQNRR